MKLKLLKKIYKHITDYMEVPMQEGGQTNFATQESSSQDIKDFDFRSRISQLLEKNPTMSDYELKQKVNDLLDHGNSISNYVSFPFEPYFPSGLFKGINKMWKDMHKSFENFEDNMFDDNSLNEKSYNSHTRYHYSLSTTENGVKKSKSMTGLREVRDGKKTTYKRLDVNDGNITTTTELLPNGQKKVTTTTKQQPVLSND